MATKRKSIALTGNSSFGTGKSFGCGGKKYACGGKMKTKKSCKKK